MGEDQLSQWRHFRSMGRCPFLLLSLVRTLPLLLLLLLLVLQQAHGAPAPSYENCGLPESNQTRAYNDFENVLIQAPCPLLPRSAPSAAAFKVCVECTSTYVYLCECCSEVVKAWGVGSYPSDRSERHGCDTFAPPE